MSRWRWMTLSRSVAVIRAVDQRCRPDAGGRAGRLRDPAKDTDCSVYLDLVIGVAG